jgi:hypothetical protein
MNENILLQTLGFDVAIDHPHTHVVRCCQLVKASKELAQASYYLATNSLHLTTMCLRYSSTVVACFCIHLVIEQYMYSNHSVNGHLNNGTIRIADYSGDPKTKCLNTRNVRKPNK